MTTRDPDTGYADHHPRCLLVQTEGLGFIDVSCTCDQEREADLADEGDRRNQERKDGER